MSGVPRAPLAVALVAATALVTGCGSSAKPPKTAVSWGATVHRVGEAWLDGDVPLAYAQRTARTAHEALEQQRKHLRPDEGSIDDARTFAARLDSLITSVGRMDDALASRDRAAVTRALADVDAATRTMAPAARSGNGA